MRAGANGVAAPSIDKIAVLFRKIDPKSLGHLTGGVGLSSFDPGEVVLMNRRELLKVGSVVAAGMGVFGLRRELADLLTPQADFLKRGRPEARK